MIDFHCFNCKQDLTQIVEDWTKHRDNPHLRREGEYNYAIITCPNCKTEWHPYYDADPDGTWLSLEEAED